MSMQPEEIGPVPEETIRVARAAFPKGNAYVQMRDVLGAIYDDATFAPLFASQGRPAEAPWRLALVTVMQFADGLSDRQAAEAVRARIDWEYALGLDLTDDGFDFSVLSEFRTRLVCGSMEHQLLDSLLKACRERGYLRVRGCQRTDSTHVLGALRLLSRLELVAETLCSALNAVAVAAPDWLRQEVAPEWYERYGRRIEEYRLSKGYEARQEYAEKVGADGLKPLADLHARSAPAELWRLPAVEILRQTWIQQYLVIGDRVRFRQSKELPSASAQLTSPYETEARYAIKRGHEWIGYKVHLTEVCDGELPDLLTHVDTTIAPSAEIAAIGPIQADLAKNDLLTAQQIVDAGYVRARNLVDSKMNHQIDLVGPMYVDHQWQALAKEGFDVTRFQSDWHKREAICPEGKRSAGWYETDTARRQKMIRIVFSPRDCAACPSHDKCSRAKVGHRSLLLQPRELHEAVQESRRRQETVEFAGLYARRAGIEGTISQSVGAFGLRRARYRGLGKTHLQHIATAAIDVHRVADWISGVAPISVRISHFAALARLNSTMTVQIANSPTESLTGHYLIHLLHLLTGAVMATARRSRQSTGCISERNWRGSAFLFPPALATRTVVRSYRTVRKATWSLTR